MEPQHGIPLGIPKRLKTRKEDNYLESFAATCRNELKKEDKFIIWVTTTFVKPTNLLFLITNLTDNPVSPQAISASLHQTANKFQFYGLIQVIKSEALHTFRLARDASVYYYALI